MLVHLAVITILLLAFADIIYLSPANSKGVPGGVTNYIPLAIFTFGIANIVVFGRKIYQFAQAGSDATTSGWRGGISLACVLAGMYLAGTSVDHWMFFNLKGTAGSADAAALGVTDIECDSMVLVQLNDRDAAYRCPKSISLGSMSASPFVPWPSYSAGRSVELKNRIVALDGPHAIKP